MSKNPENEKIHFSSKTQAMIQSAVIIFLKSEEGKKVLKNLMDKDVDSKGMTGFLKL